MEKIDLYKTHKEEYVRPRKPVLIRTKKAKYLSYTGQGAPGGQAFQKAIQAMFGVAYTIKMTRKFSRDKLPDYKVCGLEALWWSVKEGANFAEMAPEQWRWQLLIRTPDFIGKQELKAAQSKVSATKGLSEAARVELTSLTEGLVVQMLHIGPYGEVGCTIGAMCEFAGTNGYELAGKHHEIYLSDPRRVQPETLKTILRHPVRASPTSAV